MESIQIQVSKLTQKVEQLSEMVTQMNQKFSQVLTEKELAPKTTWEKAWHEENYLSSVYNHDLDLQHKDVLREKTYEEMNSLSAEQFISPEIQIQRLSAQLTAAYNRIAALEEQLLRERIH